MSPVLISVITITISVVMTTIIGVIAYFLKRYIEQSDKRNQEMHTQLNSSYEKLTDTITQLRLAIGKIQVEANGERKRCDDRHHMINGDIERIKSSIGNLWRELNKKKDKQGVRLDYGNDNE